MATTVKRNQVPGDPVTSDGASGLSYQLLFGPGPGRRLHANVVTIASGGISRAHQHEWEQVNYVLSGAGELVTGDGTVEPVEAGMAIHIPGGERHFYHNRFDEPLVMFTTLGTMPGEGSS